MLAGAPGFSFTHFLVDRAQSLKPGKWTARVPQGLGVAFQVHSLLCHDTPLVATSPAFFQPHPPYGVLMRVR